MPYPVRVSKEKRLHSLKRQIGRLEARQAVLKAQHEQFSRWRLVIFVGGMLASLVAFYALAIWWGLALMVGTLAAFAGVVRVHRRVQDRLRRIGIWQKIKETHVARMTLDWATIPLPPEEKYRPQHPFEVDLDISGARSLHHLLDTSVTVEGSQRLKDWLLATEPDKDLIARRQKTVAALRGMVLLRDKLALVGLMSGPRERVRGRLILDWVQAQQSTTDFRQGMLVGVGLTATTAVLFGLSVLGFLPPLWILSFVLYLFLWGRFSQDIGGMFENVRSLQHTLGRMRGVMGYLEKASQRPVLAEIGQIYRDAPPSRHLGRLTWVMAAVGLQQNPFAWLVLNAVVPWDLFFAYQLQVSQRKIGEVMPKWLEAWFELEAYQALANFSYLNPEYEFPTIGDEAALRGVRLGHPLLPDAKKVRNDFQLEARGQVVIITGSNMAGKSTFLRTLGVNLCLAYVGAVVDAGRLDVGLMRLYTCIRINDSIDDGISYFYAEVKRLKQLLDALEDQAGLPVFFLIDEIFRGTNNRERLLGSRAYIKALARQNGLGLIATHDLDLVRLADEFGEIRNMHFREDVREGKMVFDYRLHPGPCPTTNALKIMALEGLPVEEVLAESL